VFVALLVLAFGAYFARFIRDTVTTYGRNVKLQDASLLGKLAQYAVLAFVVLIALDQIKVGGDIIRESFLILLAGVVFAVALAFGMGGKDWAAERIEQWWPRSPVPKDPLKDIVKEAAKDVARPTTPGALNEPKASGVRGPFDKRSP